MSDKVYPTWEDAQTALDNGETVRIEMDPIPEEMQIELLRMARQLQPKKTPRQIAQLASTQLIKVMDKINDLSNKGIINDGQRVDLILLISDAMRTIQKLQPLEDQK